VAEMILYLKNTAWAFTGAGIFLAAMGARVFWKKSRTYSWFLGLAFLVLGPVFIFLANLPPNPHAVAIVEAHYLGSQLVVLLAVGTGLFALHQRLSQPWLRSCLIFWGIDINRF